MTRRCLERTAQPHRLLKTQRGQESVPKQGEGGGKGQQRCRRGRLGRKGGEEIQGPPHPNLAGCCGPPPSCWGTAAGQLRRGGTPGCGSAAAGQLRRGVTLRQLVATLAVWR